MAKPKASDFRNLSDPELSQKLEALGAQLHGLRQKKMTGQLDKPHAFKAVRRQTAQILTVKRERQHAK